VIVTDHHQPGPELPECPILHPVVSGYPYPELCATGVAYKLACALGARGGAGREGADLDLVALATVADLVPLTGENRSLVRSGIAEARRGRRPGLRALILAAGCEPERLDESDFGFRLAPRINAAGRLYRADAGVELMLTADPERAREIATELDRANLDRREAEREVLSGAERAIRDLPDAGERSALVLWGEGWHPGVVGIVASRLVERHWRPVVLLGVDEDGRAKGSGRSIPGFDLLGGLRACDEHLARYGGHKAAAGVELEADRLEEFRAAFEAHAAAELDDALLARERRIDAVLCGTSLGLRLAEQIESLGPFGKGNPRPTLLVPGARIEDVRPMGESGAHARFSLRSGGASALGVAFGVDGSLAELVGERNDLAVRLELNHWNGAVEPRVLLDEVFPIGADEGKADRCLVADAPDPQWWGRFEAELGRRGRADAAPPTPVQREVLDRRDVSAIGVLGSLLAAGEAVLAVCADASRRAALATEVVDPARFGAGDPLVAPDRADQVEFRERATAIAERGYGLVLTDWAALEHAPGLAAAFSHVVAVDPPSRPGAFGGLGDRGYLHFAWDEAAVQLAARIVDLEWPTRARLATTFRALRASSAGTVREALAGAGGHRDSPERAARRALVLIELGLISYAPVGEHDGGSVVLSAAGGHVSLDESVAFRAFANQNAAARRYLQSLREPHGAPRAGERLVVSSVAVNARADDSSAA
jgi:single-stranded-DNA-specific exonuclease